MCATFMLVVWAPGSRGWGDIPGFGLEPFFLLFLLLPPNYPAQHTAV
ncbi:predicted protein [Plenodomus lingam JN3]|uniref:Uncharacterized protein n=1 Tax=Leptosphaeria maculans (strain JN3 / isolate v23.1.3 / race Av1-4-5-6-7-8) TaxID=985895 RepID=E4ZGT3_LEPMJ|nr:predicted protein [Plenodomus lingam JN3]CBX90503.1 predicted protein [Plenodomus lingam JN3]